MSPISRGRKRGTKKRNRQGPVRPRASAQFDLLSPILLHQTSLAWIETEIWDVGPVQIRFVPEEKEPASSEDQLLDWIPGEGMWSGSSMRRLLSDDVYDCKYFDVRFEHPWVPAEVRDQLENYPKLEALADVVNEWIELLQQWLEVYQFRGSRDTVALYQQVYAKVDFPDGDYAKVVPRGPMRMTGFRTPDSRDEPLTLEAARLALAHTAARREVPSAWRLLRAALASQEEGDLKSAVLTWGAAAELAVDELFIAANAALGLPAPTWRRQTLGQKVKEFGNAGHVFPGGRTSDEIQRLMVAVRNDAAHGRDVEEDGCRTGFEVASELVRAAWQLPEPTPLA